MSRMKKRRRREAREKTVSKSERLTKGEPRIPSSRGTNVEVGVVLTDQTLHSQEFTPQERDCHCGRPVLGCPVDDGCPAANLCPPCYLENARERGALLHV